MTAAPIRTVRALASGIRTGGVSVEVAPPGMIGGYIVNPQISVDQELSIAEILFVDPTGPAALQETATTVPIQPGETYTIEGGSTNGVWANAVSTGHKFTAVLFQVTTPFPPIPTPGAFPPTQPSFVNILQSYLYQEYSDDDDLQAFVASFNSIAQNYLDTLNALNLPVYTGPIIAGALLDWVGAGLYGLPRPALSSGMVKTIGPFNTYPLNTWGFNKFKLVEPNDIVATNDDIYKRILTWHLYKGDGKIFNVRWLKRRIMRFLIGTNGTSPNIDETDQISVTFGPNSEVSIRLLSSLAKFSYGALLNTFSLNSRRFNQFNTIVTQLTPLPNVAIFKEAVNSGALELPFQYSFTITI
jgi:hypothetical protein